MNGKKAKLLRKTAKRMNMHYRRLKKVVQRNSNYYTDIKKEVN